MQTVGKLGISCLELSKFVVPISDGNDENCLNRFHWHWQSVSAGVLLYFSESLPPVRAVLLFDFFCLYYVFAGRRALLCVF